MSALEIFPLNKRPELAETCAAWSFGSWGCHIETYSLEKSIDGYAKRAANTNEIPLTWVGMIDKDIVGMISLVECDHDDHKDLSPWLASMFVHPDFLRKGYASKLIQHLHKEAKDLGYEHLYLFTPDMMDLYEKQGWKVTGKVRDTRGFYDHEKLMEIDL